MNNWRNHFLIAVQFLTRLPVARWFSFDPHDLPGSIVYFPLVGALVGVFSALVYFVAAQLFTTSIAVLLAMLSSVLVTGAIHEDGLADTADGLGGGATRERALDIMRDSRIGAYGAVALFFALAIKWLALLRLADFGVTPFWTVLIVAPMLSRLSSVELLSSCEYVRENSLTSKPFAAGINRNKRIVAALYVFIATWALSRLNITVLIFVPAAAMIATTVCKIYYRRRLGGITGDCLGATIVISELAVYLAFVAVSKFETGV